MKKKLLICGMCLIGVWFFLPQILRAELEWTTRKELDLKAPPLDILQSTDGQWIFILTPGEILVYSVTEDKVTTRIPVDKAFDRLMHSAKNNTLILSSRTEKTLKIIQLETIHKFHIAGLPFKGPEHAPITMAVFSDYQ